MKLYWKMPQELKKAYIIELRQYTAYTAKNELSRAWYHLERSHILGQSYPREHTYSHWLMLKFGCKTKNTKEILGQMIRLLVGGWKSFIGHIPVGNTGGANVPALQPLEIPDDLKTILYLYKK